MSGCLHLFRGLLLWLVPLAVCGAVVRTDDGGVLFEHVIPFVIWGGKVPTVGNGTIELIDKEFFEYLCNLESLEDWVTAGELFTSDVLLIEPRSYLGLTCNGKLERWHSGKFFAHWCALSKHILWFSKIEDSIPTFHLNEKTSHILQPDCSFLAAKLNIS
eukprot:CAMPEP_0203762044 /NCGR_PEP_ID=MMETSP0098-20131031/15011_1 /ASSEMBLY_ACC=CAM_ASM_000208 /TAXON_ID=96639 /ORGANISM=" , Strain NY0313808BC1" /LENGTH=159 /DNA_ID=CAMNT_0050656287 /DNA_START=106 /DNA_END=581 /DNA_ORIENTATION=-